MRPAEDFAARLAGLAVDLDIGGTRIFDLQIALIALEASATGIRTHDWGLVTLPRLAVVDPL